MASSSIPQRVCFAVLFGAALGAFASSLETPSVWLFTLPVAVSIFKKWERIPKAAVSTARRILWIVCGVTLVLGWILMAYPVLSSNVVTFLSLAIGYALAFLGTLFLLGDPAWPAPTTFLPATIGLFVVAGFSPLASLHLFLLVGGAAVFCDLALWSTRFRGNRALGWKLVSLALTGLAVGSIAWAIIRLLPWAQGKVEEKAVQFYVPSNAGFTGSSSYTRLGELERLKRLKKLVMRVWASSPQKLRGQVLTRFDGQGWKKGQGVRTTLLPDNAARALDDSSTQWLGELPGNNFRLRRPLGPGSLSRTKVLRADDGSGVLFIPAGTLLVKAPIGELHRDPEGALTQPLLFSTRIYGVLSSRLTAVEEPSPEVRAACLEVPEETDPRLKELAALLSQGATSTEERIRRTIEHVGNTCRYSLDVGKFESDQPVAEFLFEKKRGYCQYFASAAALLLRLQDVPTRYVGGFNVAGADRRVGHYVVRESDAHAWIEAFVPGKGWVEADPTPAAEYESLHGDLESGWLRDAVEWVRAEAAEWSVRVRQGDWRSMANLFKRWVVERPLWGLSLIVLLAGVTFVFIKSRWKSRRVARAPVDEAREIPAELKGWMVRLEKQWKHHGMARPPTRAPLEHALGLPREKTRPELREVSVQVVECYYRARFRGDRISSDEMDALRRVMEECLR